MLAATKHTAIKPELESTVLVVDDTPDKVDFMSALLRQAGYRVCQAWDGFEGLKVARRERPQLVISDVAMPRADGYTLCRSIRADNELRTTPILLVSSHHVDTASAVEGLAAGADDYLEAPFDPMRLIAKVARLIERAQIEAHYRELVEQANDIIYTHDLEGRLTSINAAGARFLNHKQEELIGKHFGQALKVRNAALKINAAIGHLREQGTLREQWEVRDGWGQKCWLDLNLSLIRERNGTETGVRGVARDITEQKKAEDRLLYDAFHDALTGLPNRALFMDRLGQAVERTKRHKEYQFAVIFLDLDRFKVINDSLGHMVGDQLLVAMSRLLESCVRTSDTVARLGGDEFTILVDDVKEATDPVHLAERIQKNLSVPFNLNGHEVFTTSSMGIALSVRGYDRPEDLLRDANIAMHQAKSHGKACHQVFDTAMHSHAMALLKLETDLRRTIERSELRIHYQPVVSLETAQITGLEALVRWQHPQRGLVYPSEFISVAEETGIIVPIDRWVIREACRQMHEWQTRYPETPLCISVNLSAKQFSRPDVVEQIKQILQETGLWAKCLKLEITESVLMSNTASATTMLAQLKDLGVELYLDDFGTGYSSLSYLQRFPIDALKIDRTFISRIGDHGENAEIARAIVTLAHNLGMKVVAEGIETPAQLAELKALSCEYGQGNLFSAPVDLDMAEKLIKTSFVNDFSSS